MPGIVRPNWERGKVFSSIDSDGRRESPDDVLVVPIGRRTRRPVRVQENILARVCVAETQDHGRHGAATLAVHAQSDSSRSGDMGPEGSLERGEHRPRVEGDLREEPLDQLDLRVRGDVPAFVREDIQSLMAAVHGELPIETEEAQLLSRGAEQIPEVVLVLADLSLQEHVDSGDTWLAQGKIGRASCRE